MKSTWESIIVLFDTIYILDVSRTLPLRRLVSLIVTVRHIMNYNTSP